MDDGGHSSRSIGRRVRHAAVVLSACAAAFAATARADEPEEAPAEGRIFWQEAFDCVLPGLPNGWEPRVAKEDRTMRISCPGMFAVETDATAPGGKALRLSAPMPLSKNARVEGTCPYATLSLYLKGSEDGMRVAVSARHVPRTFEVTRQWRRYRMTLAAPQPGGSWGNGTVPVVLRGPEKGACWVAGLQLASPAPVRRNGAKGWSQDFGLHYDHDGGVARGGSHSLRAAGRTDPDGPLPGGRQEVRLEQPADGPLVVGGWCRARDAEAGEKPQRGKAAARAGAAIRIEAYAPHRKPDAAALRKRWSGVRLARNLAREELRLNEPVATQELRFAGGTHDWAYGEVTIRPKAAVVRIVVTPSYDGQTGAAWFDDLLVKCGGANLLDNPGFETPEAQLVPSPEAPPAPFRPRRDIKSDTWPDPPQTRCPPAAQAPVVDGRCDDEAWRGAAAIETFLDCRTGEAPNRDVTALVCRDEGTLFVAFRWQGDGGGKSNHERDLPPTLKGPAVGVCIRPELLHPGRSFVDFSIGKDGSRLAGKGYVHKFGPAEKYFNGGFENKGWGFYPDEWNRPWQGKVRREGETWTAEMAIPVSSMDVNLDNDFWGINFYARTADGRTFAWSSPRERLREGWHIQQPNRSNETRYFFGRLLGMKGMRASRPYENMLRMVDAGLELLPDGSVGVAVKVARHIPVGRRELPVEVEVRLIRPASEDGAVEYELSGLRDKGEVRKVEAILPAAGGVIRVGGFAARWDQAGLYQVLTTIRLKGADLVLGELMRRVVLEERYNSFLARCRIRTELTCYMAKAEARILVESALAREATVRFSALAGGKRYAAAVVGDDRIAAGDRRYVRVDLTKLPLGDVVLAGELLGPDGRVAAKATDRLTRREPVGWAMQLNRVTGCCRVDGRWTILRARSRRWATSAEAASNEGLAWDVGVMSAHEMPPEKLDRGVAKIRAERENARIACWYLLDEPRGDVATCLDLYRRARQADPYHAMCLGWGGPSIIAGRGGNGTYRAIDVMSGAFYPFGLARSWSAPWNYTLQYGSMLYQVWGRDAAEHGIPVASWMSVIRGGNREGRPPTPAEMRCQHYLGLIHGQRLIRYWMGQTPGTYYEDLFRQIVRDHREMDIFADFLNGKQVVPLFMGDVDNIHCALWQDEAGLFCLACNPTHWKLAGRLDLARFTRRQVRRLAVRAGPDGCAALEGGCVAVGLGPRQCAMITLE